MYSSSKHLPMQHEKVLLRMLATRNRIFVNRIISPQDLPEVEVPSVRGGKDQVLNEEDNV